LLRQKLSIDSAATDRESTKSAPSNVVDAVLSPDICDTLNSTLTEHSVSMSAVSQHGMNVQMEGMIRRKVRFRELQNSLDFTNS